MAVGDIYFVRIIGNQSNQVCMNTFFFQQSGGDANLAEFLSAEVDDSWLDNNGAISNIQSDDFTWQRIDVINTNDNDDSFMRDVNYSGDIEETVAPPEFAVAFRRRTGVFGYRYSYKRFAGVPRSVITADGWSESTVTDWIDRLETCGAALGTALARGGGTWLPIQAATQIDSGTGKRFQFKLGTPSVFRQFLTGAWQYSGDATTQNSRKNHSWVAP